MLKICFIIVSCVTLLFSNRAECSSVSDNIPPAHICDVLKAAQRIHSFFDEYDMGVLSLRQHSRPLRLILEGTPYQQGASAYFSLVDAEYARLQPVAIFAETVEEKAIDIYQWHRGDKGVCSADHIKNSMKEAFLSLRGALSDAVHQNTALESSYKNMEEQVKECPILYVGKYLLYLQDTHLLLASIVRRMPEDLVTIQAYIDA